ncbi:TniB family NTP-binding protein [Halocynthiibacter styelae]|uniref:TniB family NTP-binding protein n=1 Tax=Halocynthiibacter styelae TaxID=2761955 RepID=A0A8J7IEA3_9RHOB|nr:TniB family NTP-binding protein [Paenihalocynthiibacter styelae]MBI1494519.1 TniB family NTP-binding protein [Paenihalocynthiibacter styelae]
MKTSKFRNCPKVREIIKDLRSTYMPTDGFRALSDRFDMLLDQRRADIKNGVQSNVRGIVLIGQSGAGKTSAIRELVNRNRNKMATDPQEDICEFISLKVPSPATMKFVGTSALHALGYPISSLRSGPAIWDMVYRQLYLRQVKFLHFDEAQDLARNQTDKERQSLVNTLKSVMENIVCPTGLILSGMPELKTIMNQDAQLARRLYPVELTRLHEIGHSKPVINLVQSYVRCAGIRAGGELQSDIFAQRLMQAADYEFGLLAELTVQAITGALLERGLDTELSLRDFANVFRIRSAATEGLNPFIAENFKRIQPRQVLGGTHNAPHP